MAELPNAEAFVGSGVTESGFKAAQTQLIDFIGALDVKVSAIGAGHYGVDTYATADTIKTSLPAGTIIEVGSDPDPTKNGSYTWNGTILKKNDYDPFTLSKNYTNAELQNKVLNFFSSLSDLNNIFNVIDLNQNSAFRVAQNGDLFIYGRTEAVQKILRDLEKKISPLFSVDSLNDLYLLPDKNDIPIIRIDQKGEIYIVGYSESLQTILARVQDSKNSDEIKSVTFFEKKALYVRDYLDMFTQLLASQLSISAIPHFSAQQQFTLSDSWIDSIRMNLSTERIIVAGYDPTLRSDIGVVHPQVWSFDKKIAGYKFFLGLNPYTNTNENIELPFIYGSNDPEFKKWELIPTFPTPFDIDPPNINGVTSGHCSDSGFVYDIKNGDFLFFWRRTRYRGNRDIKTATNEFMASKFDGKSWSPIYTILNETLIIENGVTDYLLSPNIVYNPNDNLYYMFTINTNGKMYRRTTNDLNSKQWSDRTECVFNISNFTPWHLDMKFVGNKLVALIHVDTAGANEYRFAVSDDFLNFNISSTSIVNNPNPALYKATFLPILSKDDFKMRIIYTTDETTTPNWQLHVTDTTTVSY